MKGRRDAHAGIRWHDGAPLPLPGDGCRAPGWGEGDARDPFGVQEGIRRWPHATCAVFLCNPHPDSEAGQVTEAKGIGRSRLRKSGAMSEGGSRNGLRFLLDPILEVVAIKLTTHHRPEMRTTETFAEVLNLLHRSVCCS